MADSLSNSPWDGSASRWPDAASFAESCLINENTGPKAGWTKDKCHLPIREPSGAYNRAAMGAAAAALAGARGGGMSIPASAKKTAARKLISLYNRFNLDIPPSLKNMAM